MPKKGAPIGTSTHALARQREELALKLVRELGKTDAKPIIAIIGAGGYAGRETLLRMCRKGILQRAVEPDENDRKRYVYTIGTGKPPEKVETHAWLKSPLSTTIMSALEDRPSGALVGELCAIVQGNSSSVSKALQRLAKYGHVERVDDPGAGREWCRLRYYLKRHEETALAAVRANAEEKKQPEPPKPVEKWVGEKAKPRDFRPIEKPQPFFAAMGPGRYVEAETWTARVYVA